MDKTVNSRLPYKPSQNKREFARHYIPADQNEIDLMLKSLGYKSLEDLFQHIPKAIRQNAEQNWGEEVEYFQLLEHMQKLAEKNHLRTSFIGDGLPHYNTTEIVPHVLNIRGLTTAYTPYQPERGQGTLVGQWIYSSLISMMTGFEAINASLYDRSTALFEALNCARKLKRNSSKVIVCDGIYPGDKEVLNTMVNHFEFTIEYLPQNPHTGRCDLERLKEKAQSLGSELAAIAFPQINHFGLLEDVDGLTDLCTDLGIKSVAIIDPMLIGNGGVKPPVQFGTTGKGVDIIVGEGQHLAIAPGFGGPGLGIFGIRYNDKDRNSIRQAPGRFISKAYDLEGRECKVLVLSTREQHIRREKATSNICSNQAFLATLAGAALLNRGDHGVERSIKKAYQMAHQISEELTRYPGVELAFPHSPFFNEFTLKLPMKASDAIEKARHLGIHLGSDVSQRHPHSEGRLLMVSFFDRHGDHELNQLRSLFIQLFGSPSQLGQKSPIIPHQLLRQNAVGIPTFKTDELINYYQLLGKQNVSPDDQIYALGSCTMKYNPYINDYSAGLPGFADLHPQVPVEDAQGCLHILYEIQETFRKMLSLAGVTTSPMAGAQGELVGLKLFQAYHHHRGEGVTRDTMLIPHSAHGTNPASAATAGFKNIVEIHAGSDGQIDLNHLSELIKQYGSRVAGIMVTNPNTSGVFESSFQKLSQMVHDAGGLVYMDGANLNAIAGIVDLGKMGVDAVHSNLHKTWSIPHGGGGPGDAIVAVSEKLVDFLPGYQVIKEGDHYRFHKPIRSIGAMQRHFGNFLHKVRCYTYLKALGTEGTRRMSSMAVLSANYLYKQLNAHFPTLPAGSETSPRMHEFIMTLSPELFSRIETTGLARAEIIPKVGKLFLDFGLHAPTVAFPEVFGLMVEPTESFTLDELNRFVEIVKAIHELISETPEVLKTVPHFTPISKIDEVGANKSPSFSEHLVTLPELYPLKIEVSALHQMGVDEIKREIMRAHRKFSAN